MVDVDGALMGIFITFLLLVTYGYNHDLSPSGAFSTFFSQPRVILVYGLLLIFGFAWFVQTFPGSIWMFIAAMSLGLLASHGVY